MAEKSGSVVDVLDRVIGISPFKDNNNNGSKQVQFIPSDKFEGSKPGYVFRSSKEFGIGYHLDDVCDANSVTCKKRARLNEGTAPTTNGGKDENGGKRSVRFDATRDTTHSIPSRPNKKVTKSSDELLAEAEEQASTTHPQKLLLDLSPRGIQSAAASLERVLQRNQFLRAQYSGDMGGGEANAEKFMTSELALNDEIVNFQAAATDISCYESLVEYGVMTSFLTLLNHENSDVAISVINVLVELLDPMSVQDENGSGEQPNAMVINPEERARSFYFLADSFVEGGGLELITSNLGRYDEAVEEDTKGIEDVLTLVESLLDLERADVLRNTSQDPNQSSGLKTEGESLKRSFVSSIVNQTTFLSWLFNFISKPTDDVTTASAPLSPAVIKLHASEVLSAILQHEDYSLHHSGARLAALPKYSSAFDDLETKSTTYSIKLNSKDKKDGEIKEEKVDGMETLLQSIASFRKSDPQSEVECEFLENVFDALSASLLRYDNVVDFVEYQGIELMLRCLREKVHSGGGALKVLNFALTGSSTEHGDGNVDDASRKACIAFIQAGGLKVLFPLYMARKSVIPRPALCSEGGSNLAKKAMRRNNHKEKALSKRAKKAAHSRKNWLAAVDRNAVNILYALTRYIDKDAPFDGHARLLVKFVEEDCEKCDRTIELCLKHDEKSRIAEYQYYKSDEAEEAEQAGVDIELAALDVKLRNGGDMFHRTCAILSFACVGSTRSHGHVRDQLKMKGSSIGVIKAGLTEFSSLLVDGSQKSQIEQYLSEI